ncbi:hypothetical protein [Candidatus Ichthyocystis hellenicum]|uniref:hypothetical protein n=1 Tax=Candidatus Ichthyocystis hellenicum TaxID=1561003 RepID=UPI0011123B24|nr:hypothetical protein [Candidatus Ichthyocystis hellenicum]
MCRRHFLVSLGCLRPPVTGLVWHIRRNKSNYLSSETALLLDYYTPTTFFDISLTHLALVCHDTNLS